MWIEWNYFYLVLVIFDLSEVSGLTFMLFVIIAGNQNKTVLREWEISVHYIKVSYFNVGYIPTTII